jgi:hypothetical protein
MANALKKINARVKHLQRLHPNTSRKTLQKQAGREYRAGKLGATSTVKRKRPAKKKTERRKAIKKIKSAHAVEGRAIKSLGSVAETTRHLKNQLENQMAWGLLAVSQAKTKTAKRKIKKRLAPIWKKLRML